MWIAVSPFIAAGVLVGHGLAYRLTGTPTDSVHEYLDHAPQVLLLLAIVGFSVTGLPGRLRIPSVWPFPLAGLATFVVQEHVERLAHTGELPWLLGSPAFVVGIVLQLPVALVVWVLARRLLAPLVEARVRRPMLPGIVLDVWVPVTFDVRPVEVLALPGRGPPSLHRP